MHGTTASAQDLPLTLAAPAWPAALPDDSIALKRSATGLELTSGAGTQAITVASPELSAQLKATASKPHCIIVDSSCRWDDLAMILGQCLDLRPESKDKEQQWFAWLRLAKASGAVPVAMRVAGRPSPHDKRPFTTVQVAISAAGIPQGGTPANYQLTLDSGRFDKPSRLRICWQGTQPLEVNARVLLSNDSFGALERERLSRYLRKHALGFERPGPRALQFPISIACQRSLPAAYGLLVYSTLLRAEADLGGPDWPASQPWIHGRQIGLALPSLDTANVPTAGHELHQLLNKDNKASWPPRLGCEPAPWHPRQVKQAVINKASGNKAKEDDPFDLDELEDEEQERKNP